MKGLNQIAIKYMNEHKKVFRNWQEGNITKVSQENGILCIKYDSGKWWHYKINRGNLEWW